MKFGKRLEAEIISEWKTTYINYKGLKGRLKAVQHEKLTKEKEFVQNLLKTKKEVGSSRHHSTFVEVPPQSLHNFRIHHEIDETKHSVNHYNDKRFPINNERTFSLQSRTYSIPDSVNDFLHKVSSVLALQKNQDHDRAPTPVPITSLETLKDEVDPEERTFFNFLDEELTKVDEFYRSREKELLNHFNLLTQQYEILKNMDGEKKKSVFGSGTKNLVGQGLEYLRSSDGQPMDHKTAKKHKRKIKKALFELYRGFELLRNYQILNHTGFIKILKKYDKISGRNGSSVYKSELERHHFVNSDETSKLLNKIEDFYMKNLEGVSRAQAIRRLRVPNNRSKTYYSSVLRVGLCLGLALPALIYSMISLSTAWEPESEYKFFVIWNLELFAGFTIPILLLLMIGVNFYVWTRLQINYKFIFELNPRDNLDYRQYFELPSIIFLGMSYIMLYYSYHYQLTSCPLGLAIFIGAVLFNPFPIFYYNARRWFIFSSLRLLGSGFIRVEFRDFFIADELNSLAFSFVILQLFGCRPSLNEEVDQEPMNLFNCYSKDQAIWLSSVLGSIPAFLRLLQCWKRYRDTNKMYRQHHLINIGKYASTIVAVILSSLYRINYLYDKDKDKYKVGSFLWSIWVIFQLFSSIYTFFWDVKMDWELFDTNSINFLLRNKLGVKYNWLYYYAIISNFILRGSWLLIAKYPDNSIVAIVVAFGEMVRRWQWNFIRVENEHVSNCGQFRAIKDIPLPFPLKTDPDIIAPDNATSDVDKDFGRSSSSSFGSLFSKKLFKKRKPRRHSGLSSNDWKDFESRHDSVEYNMYADIHEESDESDKGENDVKGYGTDIPYTTYTSIYTNYASRRLPPIIDQVELEEDNDDMV